MPAPASSTLTDEARAEIRARVAELPPLTDEQLDAIADLLVQIQLHSA